MCGWHSHLAQGGPQNWVTHPQLSLPFSQRQELLVERLPQGSLSGYCLWPRAASAKVVQLLGVAWSTRWCKGLAPSLIQDNLQSLPGPRALHGTGGITTTISVRPIPIPHLTQVLIPRALLDNPSE